MHFDEEETRKTRIAQASAIVAIVRHAVEGDASMLYQTDIANALGVVDELLSETGINEKWGHGPN